LKIHLTNNARTLRQRQTGVEARLWSKLRDRRLDGLKFRRQVPRGPYIVDFLSDEAMLIVELDGSQHAEPSNISADARRTRYLEDLGYVVVRAWNVEINRNLSGVLETIFAAASARRNTPSSALRAPSPQGEKGTTIDTE
jgi:very-short-patch-repair endonuclease